MAVPKFKRRDIDETFDEIVERYTDDGGRIDWSEVDRELADYLRKNPDLMDPEAVARKYRENRVKRSEMKWHPLQATFFDPAGWMHLGQKESVRAEQAGATDMDRWWAIQVGEFAASAAVQAKKAEWFASRRPAFSAEYPTLGAVERGVFGYVDRADEDEPDGASPRLRPLR